MSTETIQIVIAESGAPEAAAGIRSVGESAATSDAALTDLLARAGTTSAAMSTITQSSGAAGVALNEMATGATGASAALLATSNEAAAAGTRIAGVGASSTEAAAGMRTATSAGAALVATFRETAVAAQATALAENNVAAATTRSGAAHAATAVRATAHGAALHHLGEEGAVLQNKMERLELTFIALGLALGIKELIEVTDVYANMGNQLQRIKVSAADFAAKQDDIFRIAQASRQPLESVNSLYVNMSMALRNTAINATQLSTAVKTLTDGATVSGKSVSETSSALNRLGISMREGTVNGRGFLQFLVQMPEIGEKVAAALGFVGKDGFGRFVKAANDGKVSSEDFVKALVKISPVMAAEVGKMEVTVASAFVTLKNSYLDYIGRADSAAGASEKVAHAIMALADNIHAVIGTIAIITLGLGAYGIAVGTAALATAVFAFSFAGIVGLLAAATAAVFFFGNSVKLTADGSVTAFSLIWGAIKTVVEIIGQLKTWMTTTTEGAVFLGAALGTLALVIGKLAFESLVAGLRAVALWLGAAAVAIAPYIAALVLLAAEYVAVRYAAVALTQGIAAANADMVKMKDSIISMATEIKTKFTQNISDTDGPLTKMKKELHDITDEASTGLPTIIRYGQGVSGSFKDLSDKSSAANIEIVNGFGRSSGIIKQLGTDAASTSSSFSNSMGTISNSTQQVNSAVSVMGNNVTLAGGQVKNAMGQMVAATDDWASRSGADFNKVSQDAIKTANDATAAMQKIQQSVQNVHSQGSGATGSTGWSTGQENLTGDWFGSTNTGNSGGSWGVSDLSQWFGATGGSGIADINFGSGGFYANGGDFIVGGNGGTDSQKVQFMATPGERVTVETPGQQSAKAGGSGADYQRPVNVTMNVYAKDANSFRESESQITLRLANQLRRTASQLGGT
jgi:tape measure domain-containing protein